MPLKKSLPRSSFNIPRPTELIEPLYQHLFRINGVNEDGEIIYLDLDLKKFEITPNNHLTLDYYFNARNGRVNLPPQKMFNQIIITFHDREGIERLSTSLTLCRPIGCHFKGDFDEADCLSIQQIYMFREINHRAN